MIGIAVLGVDCLLPLAALRLLAARPYFAAAMAAPQLEAMASLSLDLHGDGYDLSLVFFGVYCLMIGWLVWRSGFVPRIIGALMVLAGLCYLINSLADLAAPAFARTLSPHLMDPTLPGEPPWRCGYWSLVRAAVFRIHTPTAMYYLPNGRSLMMSEGADKVWAHPFLWIVTVTVIAFNVAAAMGHNVRLTYLALLLTGMAALVAICFGIWAALVKTTARRQP